MLSGKRVESALHSQPDLTSLIEEFFARSFSTENALITEAVQRMLLAGGKRLRPRLLLLSTQASGANPSDHLPLAAYMELIHVGTLIHDDIVDRADRRRGVNATAIDFGNRVSVLAGDYLFAWIFKNVTADYAHPVPHILAATLADITDGEVLQNRAVGRLDLSLSEYVEIAIKKTATLFAASAECGAIVAGAAALRAKALRDFGLFYGIAFQMLDDLLDLTASESELGKPAGNDLVEHKMTIPLILALEAGDADFRASARRFYAKPLLSSRDVSELIEGIAACGGLERTREAIGGYVERAEKSLGLLGNAPVRAELVAMTEALSRESAARAR